MPTKSKTVTEIPEPKSLLEALLAVRKRVGAVEKAESNDHFRFMFRGIETVLNAITPAMDEFGVVSAPSRVVKVDVLPKSVVITMEYVWLWGDESMTVQVVSQQADAIKAMSVAYRINFLQTLGLPTGEPDPDASAHPASSGPEEHLSGPVTDDGMAEAQARVQTVWVARRGPFNLDALREDYTQRMGNNLDNATAGDLHRYADLMEGGE